MYVMGIILLKSHISNEDLKYLWKRMFLKNIYFAFVMQVKAEEEIFESVH